MENFRIESLEINKIGAFEHLKMDFPKKTDPEKAEIHILTGENGTGKTTFIRMLAGLLKSDEEEKDPEGDHGVPELNISYKPQKISPKFEGSVRRRNRFTLYLTILHVSCENRKEKKKNGTYYLEC